MPSPSRRDKKKRNAEIRKVSEATNELLRKIKGYLADLYQVDWPHTYSQAAQQREYETALKIKPPPGMNLKISCERSESSFEVEWCGRSESANYQVERMTIEIQSTTPHRGRCLGKGCLRHCPSLKVVYTMPHQSLISSYLGPPQLPISTNIVSGSRKGLRLQLLEVVRSIKAKLEQVSADDMDDNYW